MTDAIEREVKLSRLERRLPRCFCKPNRTECDLRTCPCPLHYRTAKEYFRHKRIKLPRCRSKLRLAGKTDQCQEQQHKTGSHVWRGQVGRRRVAVVWGKP